MNIAEKIQNLCDALNAVGIKSDIGKVYWPDGDEGFVIHAGENTDDLLKEVDGKMEVVGQIDTDLFSLSFRSDGTLKDYENACMYMQFNED